MMKTLVVALTIVVLAGTAFAQRPMGPMNLYVYADGAGGVDYPDGTGILQNDGAEAFGFDGYTITSAAGLIGTVQGIFNNTVADMVGFPEKVGLTMSEALAWTDLSMTANNFTEVTMGKAATLQAGDGINLGVAFLGLDAEDGELTYVDSASDGSYQGQIIVVPEPMTMSLLGLGALALIRRRR